MLLSIAIGVVMSGLALTHSPRLQEVHNVFYNSFDSNTDGVVSYVEFYWFLKTFDVDNDGRLTQDEFVGGIRNRFPRFTDLLRELLHFFTYDRVGTIKKFLDRAYYGLDINSDGELAEDEFYRQCDNILGNSVKIATTPIIDIDNGTEHLFSEYGI